MSEGKGKKEKIEYAWTDGELAELRKKFGKNVMHVCFRFRGDH